MQCAVILPTLRYAASFSDGGGSFGGRCHGDQRMVLRRLFMVMTAGATIWRWLVAAGTGIFGADTLAAFGRAACGDILMMTAYLLYIAWVCRYLELCADIGC
ncbi:hypothetical protein AVEN_195263-1 [Araneus ventricosus]|uniref:Uncharacterized protein n=1 Tax=Araneus ventricosus TaxID=182803 RepID=A0A4Y2W0Q4_ARAVE|nr:hypothetical protein AVEN_195263-1 [Araneus ventricosus]